MSQSIHQQLIRGIEGLNASQAHQLQGLLARVMEGQIGDLPPGEAALAAVENEVGAEAGSGAEIDGDLPQPVCAQEEQPATPPSGWGPPPLSGINYEQMQLIASLIREANEARNARRQRFGV